MTQVGADVKPERYPRWSMLVLLLRWPIFSVGNLGGTAKVFRPLTWGRKAFFVPKK